MLLLFYGCVVTPILYHVVLYVSLLFFQVLRLYCKSIMDVYAIYKKIRRNMNIYGCAVVDLDKVYNADHKALNGSLAEIVKTEDKYVSAYVQFLLGKVICCYNDEKICEHKISITKECMLYKGYAVSAINKDIYSNEVLKLAQFGNDTYKFRVVPNPVYAEYYAMTMSPMLDLGNEGLFNYDFTNKFQTIIDNLFSQIISDDIIGNSAKNVEMFSKYKTYLSFDLLATDSIGKTEMLSKSINTKSGGELQTPFYIAVLASFAQLYKINDIDYGGFKMFVRLKNNIINTLQPLNMDLDSYNCYKNNGLKKDDNYITKLKLLCDNSDYHIFNEVINAISEMKTTVEQESFLEREIIAV